MKPRVYCGGTFDCFHPGHVRFLQSASEYGEVIVGLNTDHFAAHYKRLPVMRYEERKEVLEACRYVTRVICNVGSEDSKPAILEAAPSWIVHGDDWTGPDYMKQLGVTQNWLDEHKIGLLYVPYTKSISTSEVIRRARLA